MEAKEKQEHEKKMTGKEWLESGWGETKLKSTQQNHQFQQFFINI